jgi:hypothetical protein
MIWFACKQCGKRHGRADNLAGTLVFCECGQGNRVPWSSTVPEPETPEPPPPAPPRRPAEPAPQVPSWLRRRPSLSSPEDEDEPDFPPGHEPDRFPPRRRPRAVRRPNPAFCLNHDEAPSEHTCAACRLRFCSACVITLQGQTLCGPCKNFRVRGLHRAARITPLAILALVIALVSGPVAVVLTFMAFGAYITGGRAGGPVVLCLLGLILPVAGLVLGGLALRDIETRPNVAGRSLALTGATTGLIGVLWSLTIAGILVLKHLQG